MYLEACIRQLPRRPKIKGGNSREGELQLEEFPARDVDGGPKCKFHLGNGGAKLAVHEPQPPQILGRQQAHDRYQKIVREVPAARRWRRGVVNFAAVAPANRRRGVVKLAPAAAADRR